MLIDECLGSTDFSYLRLRVLRVIPAQCIGSRLHEDSQQEFWNCAHCFILKVLCSNNEKRLGECRYDLCPVGSE